MNGKKLIRWPRLVLGTLSLIFAGMIYGWSILKAPFVSEFGWNPTQLGFNYTLTICFFALGGFFSGLLTKRTSPRVRMLISAVLMFAGFFITSRLNGQSVILLYIAYGIICGTGVGFAYNTVIGVTNTWYPDNKGLCSGILLFGFGLSSLIIGRIAGSLFETSIGWRTTYLIIAVCIFVVLVATAFILKYPDKGTVFPAPKNKGKKVKPKQVADIDFSASQMAKRFSFWRLFVFMMLLTMVGGAAISFAKDILVELGSAEQIAITLVGILSLFNAFGRFVSGFLSDSLGMRKTQYVTSAVALAAPLLVVISLVTGSLVLGVFGICLCGFSYGFAPTISASFVYALYGEKHFAINFPLLNLVLIPSSFAATLAGALYKSTGSFESTFIILICCSVVGLFFNLSVKKP